MAKIERRQQIDFLRALSKKERIELDDAKLLRILASQIEKELEEHNRISKESRKQQKVSDVPYLLRLEERENG